MRVPSLMGIINLRSTMAIDCSSFSIAFRRAMRSADGAGRPCEWTTVLSVKLRAMQKTKTTRLTTQTVFFMDGLLRLLGELNREGLSLGHSLSRTVLITSVQVSLRSYVVGFTQPV